MNAEERVEIGIYRFTEWSGEVIDTDQDVKARKALGIFTWRVEGQPVPEDLVAIRRHATFRELADIEVLALNIQDYFPFTVPEDEVRRIATELVAKISTAMLAVKPGERLSYIHSARYTEMLGASPRRSSIT